MTEKTPPATADFEERLSNVERKLGMADPGALGSGDDSMKEYFKALSRFDRRWREHLLDGIRGMAPYVGVRLQGTVYFFDTSDPKSSRTLFLDQVIRRDQVNLRRAVDMLEARGHRTEGKTFVDIGAHIGTTTVYAIRHLGFEDAVAVEPSTENMRLLRLTALANGLEGMVRTFQGAVSDEVGYADLSVGGVGSEYHRLATGTDAGPLRQPVATTTLDTLVAQGMIDPARVGLLWMDIEGQEGRALRAASSLVSAGVPVVLELCPDKLKAAGGDVPGILAEHYSHILDIRKPAASVEPLPASEVRELLASYDGHCVDVLAWREADGGVVASEATRADAFASS